MNTENIETENGRYGKPNWNMLPFAAKERYNTYLADTFQLVAKLIEEIKLPYRVNVFLKANEEEVDSEFPIDFDRTVIALTTDVVDNEGYKEHAGVAITGAEHGLIRIIEGVSGKLRDQGRYYYLNKLEALKMSFIQLATQVTGLKLTGQNENVLAFTFAYNPGDWVFSIQATPKSSDPYFDLTPDWQKQVAFMYAMAAGAEPQTSSFRKFNDKLRHRATLEPFSLNIETGENYEPWEAPLVNTVEVARYPNIFSDRRDNYEFRGDDIERYGSDLDRIVRCIMSIVDVDMNMRGDAEVFWSRDDEREHLLQPEMSAVSLVTSRQNREEAPLDEADIFDRTVKGTLVIGIEHGLVWMLDTLLNQIAVNVNKYARSIPYKLLAIRSAVRGIVHEETNIQIETYSGSKDPETPVGSLYEFTLWEGGDRWEIAFTRIINFDTPESILIEEDKVNLVIALAGSLGVNLKAKPVVRYVDGKPVTITTRNPGHNSFVETTIVTGDRDDTPVPIYGRDARGATQVNTPIEQEVTYSSTPTPAEEKLIGLFANASDDEKREIAEKIKRATENVVNKLRDRITEFMVTGVDPGNPIRDKIDVILDVPQEIVTMNGFQSQILVTANETLEWRDQVMNAALGLGGETGEVVEEIVTAVVALHGANAKILDLLKKYFFHNWSEKYYEVPGSYEAIREKIAKELGDNLFYNAWLARLFGFTLGEIAQTVRLKLVDRHGEGSPNGNDTTESPV